MFIGDESKCVICLSGTIWIGWSQKTNCDFPPNHSPKPQQVNQICIKANQFRNNAKMSLVKGFITSWLHDKMHDCKPLKITHCTFSVCAISF